MTALTPPPGTGRLTAAAILLWAAAVAAASAAGVFAALPLPLFGLLVGALIAALVVHYRRSAALQALVRRIGLRRLTALHVWRIPAALAFFHYGAAGLLPPVFVTLAGWGDLLAGVLALVTVTLLPARPAAYWTTHVVGAVDFALAVGTGLVLSLAGVPAMATIALFPLALIPLFGVTLSGATHVMAFDLLREARRAPPPSAESVRG